LDRVFLDANVLFSAAYRPEAGVLKLWKLKGVELITSTYALQEARINLDQEEQRARLDRLAESMRIFPGYFEQELPKGIKLHPKDRPILATALGAKATHLLTGDVSHFGQYYGQTIAGVLILPPADYLLARFR